MIKSDIKLFYHLDLVLFKTLPCEIKKKHATKKCFFYHHLKEKRRNIEKTPYCKEMCKNKNDC